MILKLVYDQVSKIWETIQYAVLNSVPPYVGECGDTVNNIMQGISMGRIHCVVIIDEKAQGKDQLHGVATFDVVEDEFSGSKHLLLYSFFAYRPLTESMWREFYDYSKALAKGWGCQKMVFYTKSEKLISLASKIAKIDTSQYVVTMEV